MGLAAGHVEKEGTGGLYDMVAGGEEGVVVLSGGGDTDLSTHGGFHGCSSLGRPLFVKAPEASSQEMVRWQAVGGGGEFLSTGGIGVLSNRPDRLKRGLVKRGNHLSNMCRVESYAGQWRMMWSRVWKVFGSQGQWLGLSVFILL